MRNLLSPGFYILLATLLSGCSAVVLQPSGDIAAQQRDLLVMSTLLMLLIILPVMALTAYFAWKYRASNTTSTYEPEWDHSTKLELVIWACPLLIIICLGALTWVGTHLLDPYRPLSRVAHNQALNEAVQPLDVQVVALDWKWLFIYPEYGIATVNELAAPVDRPINFRITASSVMNAFYVPALAGMIYAMPGMETKLHAVINHPGTYTGFSANYSGDGFSHMRFKFTGMDQTGFDAWVNQVKASSTRLDRSLYLSRLERPSENEPVAYYGTVDAELYPAILNMCVNPGKMCMGMMMAIDSKGGLGLEGARLVEPLAYDKYQRRGSMTASAGAQKTFVQNICSLDEQLAAAKPMETKAPQTAELRGYGLPSPDTARVNTLATILKTALSHHAAEPMSAQKGR